MNPKTLSLFFSLQKKLLTIGFLFIFSSTSLGLYAKGEGEDQEARYVIQQMMTKDPYGINPETLNFLPQSESDTTFTQTFFENEKGIARISKEGISITIKAISSNSSLQSKVVGGQSLLTGDKTDILTQEIEGGMRQLINIKSKDAERYYDFSVNLPDGYSLSQNAKGVVAILKQDKSVYLLLAKPWAVDANGENIDTYYTIESGNILRQHVKFTSKSKFPIVADPTWCGDFIQSTSWIYRSGTHPWSLSISPTACGRLTVFSGGGFYVNDSWEEMLSKTPVSSHWDKSPGTSIFESMYYQYACHANFVMLKDFWNLEPTRPNVGYLATVAAGCNPN